MTLVIASTLLLGCAKFTEHSTGVVDGQLTNCPAWPRCVSSSSEDFEKQIAPFRILGDVDHAWAQAREALAAMERTRIANEGKNYLHAEVVSPWHVYTDDLELLLRPAERRIDVRSSARIGYYDFNVNRDRVEALRDKLAERGVVERGY